MTHHQPNTASRMRPKEAGFSLVELMIGTAIGLIILAALSYVLVSNISSRNELEKGSRQMESGRYALAALAEDIQLAGFYGEYFPATTGLSALADPCTLKLQEMEFGIAGGVTKVPVGLYGFANGVAASTNCAPYLATRKADTDVLVVRRASTASITIDADGNNTNADANVTMEDGTAATYASLGKGHYLQASNCSEVGAATESAFVMDHDTSKFVLHKAIEAGTPASCMTGTLNNVRRYMVRIFYISHCNICTGAGDGIPTLKMRELVPQATVCDVSATVDCGDFAERAIADGIEDLQLEYGLDTSLDGVPDTFSAAPATAEWQHAVAVKVFLLARNTEKTIGYANAKTYVMSSDGSLTRTPIDNFKRHLYSATTRANNLAGRRP